MDALTALLDDILRIGGVCSLAYGGYRFSRRFIWHRAGRGRRHVQRYDPAVAGYFKIADWGPRHRLDPNGFELIATDGLQQDWFDQKDLADELTRYSVDPGGPTWYLVDIDHVDHRESDSGATVRALVAPSKFSEYRAVRR